MVYIIFSHDGRAPKLDPLVNLARNLTRPSPPNGGEK